MKKVRKARDKVAYVFALIAGFAVVAQMLFTCADVFCRNILGFTLVGAYESTQYILMPVAIFMGMPIAYASGIMPSLADFADKFPKAVRTVMKWSIFVLEIAVYAILTYCGINGAKAAINETRGVVVSTSMLPTYPVFLLIPLSFGIVLIFSLIKYLGREGKSCDQEMPANAGNKVAADDLATVEDSND